MTDTPKKKDAVTTTTVDLPLWIDAPALANSASNFNLIYGLPPAAFDSRETARITRVHQSTQHLWISREPIPGVEVGPPGKPRVFSADFVFHLAVMGALVRLGYGSAFANNAAITAHSRMAEVGSEVKLVVSGVELGTPQPRPVYVVRATDWAAFAAEIDVAFPAGEGFTVIDIGAIWRRVHDAAIAKAAEQKPPT